MNKQHHFIVYYDTDTGEWDLDINAEEVKFNNKTVYDTKTDQWELAYLGDGEYNDNNDDIADKIYMALKQLNKGDNQ